MTETQSGKWSDFTVAAYTRMVKKGRQRYAFSTYCEEQKRPHVLWRHDVDFSPQRALRLASIERDLDVVATYFFGVGLSFYNPLEPAIRELLKEILGLGHRLGLHFEATGVPAREQVLQAIGKEADILEYAAGTRPEAISFHNPTSGLIEAFPDDRICGLVNTYSRRLRDTYLYCSDSNGYWRHRPIPEVLESTNSERLQILTHPVWWTEEKLSPKAKVERCVRGRATAVIVANDAVLTGFDRTYGPADDDS